MNAQKAPQNLPHGYVWPPEIPPLGYIDTPSPGTAWNLQNKCHCSLVCMLFLGSATQKSVKRPGLWRRACMYRTLRCASQRGLHNVWGPVQSESVKPFWQTAGKKYHYGIHTQDFFSLSSTVSRFTCHGAFYLRFNIRKIKNLHY